MNFEKSLLNIAFCSVPGGRSNVTYFGKLDPGDLGLLYSRTCWVLLLVLKEGEILQPSLWQEKLALPAACYIYTFIFTNLITQCMETFYVLCPQPLCILCSNLFFNTWPHVKWLLLLFSMMIRAKDENYFMEMEITGPKGRARPVRAWHTA